MNRRYTALSALAGAGWGALTYWFGNQAFPHVIWAGVVVSPLIGLVAGWLYRPTCAESLGRRVAMRCATLCVAVTMFGLGLGWWDAARPLPSHGSGTGYFGARLVRLCSAFGGGSYLQAPFWSFGQRRF